MPESALPPPRVGGGGTTAADPERSDRPVRDWEPLLPEPFPKLAGGGTTVEEEARVPLEDRPSDPALLLLGGGGTGCERRSPVRVLPQLLRS